MTDTDIPKRRKMFSPLFMGTVLIPTLLGCVYFGLIASDVYISESRFVIRSPERQGTSPLGAIFESVGFSRAEDDAFAVQNFMLSRDAARRLDQELEIKKMFSRSEIDVFSRFAGIDWDDSFENFHQYYLKRVIILLDPASSIGTLEVRAYSATESHAINEKLLQYGETMVNNLNERGRQDLIRYAKGEVLATANQAKAAGLALAKYRDEKGVIDPEAQSSIPLQQIARLQDELIATKAQILQIENVARNNSQLPILRQRAQLLAQEIREESERVAGGGRSLASKAAEFQRLTLEKEFADRMLASAMSTLEQARNEAQRQQLYLERIVQPNFPDRAMEPRRLRGSVIVFVLALIAWGMLSMLIAAIREHQD